MLPPNTTVLVVGAGPAGLTIARFLELQGVDVLVVERREGPQRAPAAHVVNARSLEVFRAAGVDRAALEAASIDPKDGGFVDWVSQLGQPAIGRVPFERQGDDQLAVTPTPLRNLSQNKLEPILVDTLEGDVSWRCQWESAEQDGEGVTSRIRDLSTDEVHEVRAQYLIAADGAGSRIRKACGIEPQGPEKLETFVMIHFEASLRPILGPEPAVLNFLVDPTCSGAFVVHDLDREAVFMHAYDDTKESLADFDEKRCEELVRAAIADPSLDFQIRTISTWAMTAQVAERYRDDRIFLVGDSAHRFPPTGGLGLNSGVQDAHNLAWKLAEVLAGRAGEELLDTYESERRPIAQNNANQSLRNALLMLEVMKALGLADPEVLGNPEAGRERLQATLASAEGREKIDAAIALQEEHFDMPGLQLGFSYAEGAPPPDLRNYEPSGAPGSRVPHAWLAKGPDGERQSLLDRLPTDRFALLVGPEGGAWNQRAAELGDSHLQVLDLANLEFEDLSQWLEVVGIEASGALLVRPDQHVAWRASSEGPAAELPDRLADARSGRAISLDS